MEISNNQQFDSSIYLNANQALNRISTDQNVTSSIEDSLSSSITKSSQIQQSGISQSIDNINTSIAQTQIKTQALTEQSEILDSVKEKLQNSINTTSQEGRETNLNDIQGLLNNFNDIASSTNYNGQTLLQNSFSDSSQTQAQQLQVGEDIIEFESIQSNTQGLDLNNLLNQDPAAFTPDQAREYLGVVDNASNNVSNFQATLQSTQNQLQDSSKNLLSEFTQTNTSSAVIQKVDYTQEVANFSKQNVLAQIGAYGIAQSSNINQSTVSRLLS